ncbi:MAG TPA: glycerophosphodiester phosphodiesterase [Pyrinomonadaceae bacterium]|nr:glycerophosphodiester phosphodiesterase [Pyrinomonadaceae bacterium]
MKSDPPSPQNSRLGFFEQASDVDLIAHRGGNGQWPGETTYAFKRALASGADVIEMDVWGTADDPPVLVLMHSSDISKVTENSGKVSSLTFKQLEHLNAAFGWSPDGGRTFPFAKTEPVITLARLEDVLKEFKDRRMNIEIKQKRPSIVKPLLDLIERYGVPAENLLMASFHTSVLKEFRKECEQRNLPIATSASTWEWVRYYFGNYVFHIPYRPPAEALQMAERLPVLRFWLLTRGFIRKAHDAGLKVHAWTIDDPEDMQRAIINGIDGIITDFPGPLRAILDEPDRARSLPRVS